MMLQKEGIAPQAALTESMHQIYAVTEHVA